MFKEMNVREVSVDELVSFRKDFRYKFISLGLPHYVVDKLYHNGDEASPVLYYEEDKNLLLHTGIYLKEQDLDVQLPPEQFLSKIYEAERV